MNDEEEILAKTIQITLQEKEKTESMLRTVNDMLNMGQDIEDILDDENLLESVKLLPG
jgi:hypothetical protein